MASELKLTTISSPSISGTPQNLSFTTNGITRLSVNGTTGTITASASITPSATATYDLGTSGLRWRNIYTNDLHLSNGIGDYTIVEGEEDLFLVNNKNGKHYKFALIEVNPSEVPPKASV